MNTDFLQNKLSSLNLKYIFFIIVILLGKVSVIQASESAPVPEKPPSPIQLRNFKSLKWSPDQKSFHSNGNVQIDYGTVGTTSYSKLIAHSIDYDEATHQVQASGGIQLTRLDGIIYGQEIKYNLQTHVGYVTEAIAVTDIFRMTGKRIETTADGSYTVINGTFTTCVNGKPDYHVRAGRLTINPNRAVSGKNITLFAGPTALISLPTFKRDLRAGGPVTTPLPGYSVNEGLTLNLKDSLISKPHKTLDYDIHLNLRNIPTGSVVYQSDISQMSAKALPPRGLNITLSDPQRGFLEQLTPPTYAEYIANQYDEEYRPRTTFFAAIQNKQFVFNRRRNDLNVSRFPEIGVRFANIFGRSLADDSPKSVNANAPLGSGEAHQQKIPNTPFLMDVNLAAGEIKELPTNMTAARFSIRTNMASQPFTIGKRLSWRLGMTNWLNHYSTGTIYDELSPEVEVDYVPTRTSIFGAGYRYATDTGRTPFFFDRRDIRHELRLQYQVNGPLAFGILSRYDLERARVYDTEIALLKNYDCMQIGVSYRTRSQSVNILFNLLPPGVSPRAKRRNPIESLHSEQPKPSLFQSSSAVSTEASDSGF